MFCDSEIAKKISCGRTKSEKIVCGVLAPKALQKVLLELKNGFDEGPTYFGISSDESNKKKLQNVPRGCYIFSSHR